MQFISDYMRDEKSRHMLNELTQKVFGFDFEGWVISGGFEGDYIPFSFVEDGKMISNVSANRMKFMQNGTVKNYIQIGTVMTDEDHRKQGLAAKLISRVIEEYGSCCDGFYLFGNLNALGFYEKMGFGITNQYRYFIKDEYCKTGKELTRFRPIAEMGEEMKQRYIALVRNAKMHSSFEQLNKYGLQMFYTGGFDNVFYADDIDCFVVLDEEDCTVLQSVHCKDKASLSDVIRRLDLVNGKCRLGYTPLAEDLDLCTSELYDGSDDYRLFYKGRELESIERDRLYFPELSHA